MLLDQVFNGFDNVKWVFIRKGGKMRKVRRIIPNQNTPVADSTEKPMFPISKERK